MQFDDPSMQRFAADKAKQLLWKLACHPDLDLPDAKTPDEKYEYLKACVEQYIASQAEGTPQ